MSNGRMDQILTAAYQCFTRHGIRRTTMDDIATAAGMSRPAVYRYVRNKDEAYRLLAAGLFDRSLADARAAAAADHAPLAERLYGVLAAKLDLTLRLWRDSPHAADLLYASTRITGDLVETYTRQVTDLVADTVAGAAGDRARSFAEVAVALTRGLEADPTDPELPRLRLREGVALLVAGLRPRE